MLTTALWDLGWIFFFSFSVSVSKSQSDKNNTSCGFVDLSVHGLCSMHLVYAEVDWNMVNYFIKGMRLFDRVWQFINVDQNHSVVAKMSTLSAKWVALRNMELPWHSVFIKKVKSIISTNEWHLIQPHTRSKQFE